VTSALLVGALLLPSAGCKKQEEAVKRHVPPAPPAGVKDSLSGYVRYHGIGLASGFVEVFGDSGKSVKGIVMMGGTYTVWDPPRGKVKISVSTKPPAGLSKAPPATTRPGNVIPTRYADPDTSGLSVTIGGGNQTFNINLED
jgi:hypothetical protein